MNVFANRIPVEKILALESLINHGHEARMYVVLRSEETPPQQRNTHCFQIVGSDKIVQGIWHFGFCAGRAWPSIQNPTSLAPDVGRKPAVRDTAVTPGMPATASVS